MAARRPISTRTVEAKRELIVALAHRRVPAARIAVALDLNRGSVRSTISRLRSRGVALPLLPPGRPRTVERKPKRLDWCPPEHRDDYRTLRRHGYSAAEARQAIERDLMRRAAA